jgi:hypothetical protein
MIKAKRALDKAEAQRKLQAAREQFLLLPETEKVDLRVCQMQDLLTEISDSSLDAIVSDPPEECARFYGELAELAATALKPRGTLAVTCGQGHLPQVLAEMAEHIPYRWTMCYLAVDQAVQVWDSNVSTSWKPLLVFGRGQKWMGDVVKGDMEKLVERLTEPGMLVCDPFLGPGEIAVACVNLTRRIIGCDADKSRVEKARARTTLARRSDPRVCGRAVAFL